MGCGAKQLGLWKTIVNLSIEDLSKYYIDALINKNTKEIWRFTSFYGEPETCRRSEAWAKLRRLNSHPNIPWFCAGNFNEILKHDAKLGGALRNHSQMQLFREVIDECGFIDLGFVGPKFTWSRYYANGHSIWERINKSLATNS